MDQSIILPINSFCLSKIGELQSPTYNFLKPAEQITQSILKLNENGRSPRFFKSYPDWLYYNKYGYDDDFELFVNKNTFQAYELYKGHLNSYYNFFTGKPIFSEPSCDEINTIFSDTGHKITKVYSPIIEDLVDEELRQSSDINIFEEEEEINQEVLKELPPTPTIPVQESEPIIINKKIIQESDQ